MNSIRLRLIAILIAVLGALWGAGVLWSYHSTQTQIERVLDARLQESARMVSSMVSERGISIAPDGSQSPFRSGDGYSRQLTCQIWTLDGSLVTSSDSAPGEALSETHDGFAERVINGERWRSYAISNPAYSVRVLVGDKVEFRSKLVGDVVKGLLVPLVLIMPLAAMLIWWAVTRGMRPLSRLAEALSGRDASNLHPFAAAKAPKELKPPMDALNALLERVEDARGRERAFTAYAAHELKTPLAGIKTQAQIALASTDETIRNHALSQILRGVDRTDRLVRQLLDLARIETTEMDRSAITADPAQTVQEAIHDLDTLCRQRDVTIVDRSLPDQLLAAADADLLRLAVRNVLENAVLVSKAGQEVSIAVGNEHDRLIINIKDDGPGMSPDDLAAATQRFYRGRHTSERGSGLGLSIVEVAMRRLGGSVDLRCQLTGGLQVTLLGPVQKMPADLLA